MPIQKINKPEIIRKAVEIFHKQGYLATSMSDLAKACGLLKGSFYHYFASKEELMQAVLATVREYYQKRIFAVVQNKELTVHERLTHIWNEQKHTLSHQFGGCLFGNMALETANVNVDFRPALRGFFDDWKLALSQLLSETFPAQEATQIATQAIMMMEGAALLARLYEDDSYLEQAFLALIKQIPARL
jgi:TetR/AcrR family transcriptional regulator, transcriptional repressor for nem operon